MQEGRGRPEPDLADSVLVLNQLRTEAGTLHHLQFPMGILTAVNFNPNLFLSLSLSLEMCGICNTLIINTVDILKPKGAGRDWIIKNF